MFGMQTEPVKALPDPLVATRSVGDSLDVDVDRSYLVPPSVSRARDYRDLSRAISTQQVYALQPELLREIRKPGSAGSLRWMAFWEAARKIGIDHMSARRLFSLFDVQPDGTITKVEIEAALKALEKERGFARYCPTCNFTNDCAYCEKVTTCADCTSEIWCPMHWSMHPGRPEYAQQPAGRSMHNIGVDPFAGAVKRPDATGDRQRRLEQMFQEQRRADQKVLQGQLRQQMPDATGDRQRRLEQMLQEQRRADQRVLEEQARQKMLLEEPLEEPRHKVLQEQRRRKEEETTKLRDAEVLAQYRAQQQQVAGARRSMGRGSAAPPPSLGLAKASASRESVLATRKESEFWAPLEEGALRLGDHVERSSRTSPPYVRNVVEM